MTAAEAVHRALNAAHGPPYKYHLGSGGFSPDADTPNPALRLCDCSGYISWCLGISREQPHTLGWIETTLVRNDAIGPQLLFQRVQQALPGDVVVYGDKNGHEGHIGLVTSASDGKALRVAHCCARSGLRSAIVDEPASVFWTEAIAHRGAIYARYKGFTEEEDMEEVKIVVDGVASKFRGRFDEKAMTNLIPLAAVKPLLRDGVSVAYDKEKKTLAIKTK